MAAILRADAMAEWWKSIVVFSVILKSLLIPAYHSSDFEVHRNWLAITNSLPLSRWYYEGRTLEGSFWFAVLLNFKHIFLYIAPAYFVFLLRSYCSKAGYFPKEVINKQASMTGGLVGQTEHLILPAVPPIVTMILTLLSVLPALLHVWFRPSGITGFLRCLILCAFGSFLFGWHVHEKAILMVIIPLSGGGVGMDCVLHGHSENEPADQRASGVNR
ncbi:hypothetical protein ACROYT_G020462 [Oculina patagonica]